MIFPSTLKLVSSVEIGSILSVIVPTLEFFVWIVYNSTTAYETCGCGALLFFIMIMYSVLGSDNSVSQA
jgi:hypothetical protein